jgi:hypothetical protein
VPLVIEVGNADIMATLLKLKTEAEERWGTRSASSQLLGI